MSYVGAPSIGYEESGAWWSGLTDHQGSLIGLVSGSGTPTAFTHYDPYGAPRPGSTVPTGIGHAGEWADATGLTNLRFRAYDPAIGRFISRDSFGGVASAPLTGNRYLYGLGNPLRYTDPSGHFAGQVLGGLGSVLNHYAGSALLDLRDALLGELRLNVATERSARERDAAFAKWYAALAQRDRLILQLQGVIDRAGSVADAAIEFLLGRECTQEEVAANDCYMDLSVGTGRQLLARLARSGLTLRSSADEIAEVFRRTFSSARLGTNLEASGAERAVGQVAHQIVSGGHQLAHEARTILARWHIDIDDGRMEYSCRAHSMRSPSDTTISAMYSRSCATQIVGRRSCIR